MYRLFIIVIIASILFFSVKVFFSSKTNNESAPEQEVADPPPPIDPKNNAEIIKNLSGFDNDEGNSQQHEKETKELTESQNEKEYLDNHPLLAPLKKHEQDRAPAIGRQDDIQYFGPEPTPPPPQYFDGETQSENGQYFDEELPQNQQPVISNPRPLGLSDMEMTTDYDADYAASRDEY